MKNHSAIIISLVRTFARRDAFFGVWFVMVVGFVSMMVWSYRKSRRRQFRGAGERRVARATLDPRRMTSLPSARDKGTTEGTSGK